MNIIETYQLKKTFHVRQGKNKTVEAVRGVDLRVQAGEIFGFLGPNGAGKSTTLRMLTTLLTPSEGQAKVAGFDLLKEPRKVREKIGYVGQVGGTDMGSTGRENLMLQAQLYGMSRRDAQQRTDQLLTALELNDFADRVAKTYSGGQKRRLELALGMVHRPQLLFLDEPTTGLDPQSRAHLWEEVRKLRHDGTTIFITTHYLEEADALADRLAIMDEGKIVAEGTPIALKKQIAGDVVKLGFHNGNLEKAQAMLQQQAFVREAHQDDNLLHLYVEHGESSLPQILRLLDGTGITVQTLALARPSLDDVFLRQTGRSLRESEN